MRKIFFYAVLIVVLASCSSPKNKIEKPAVFKFNELKKEIVEEMRSKSRIISERVVRPATLPTVKLTETVVRCMDFYYAGKERPVELVFSDDTLVIARITIESGEFPHFLKQFNKQYSSPVKEASGIAFFDPPSVIVREQPAEVVFISPRLADFFVNSPELW